MTGDIHQKDILTVEEAAEYLDLNTRTIQQMIKDGELPATKIGKSYRFSRRLLLEFIESKIKKEYLETRDNISTTTLGAYDDLSSKQ